MQPNEHSTPPPAEDRSRFLRVDTARRELDCSKPHIFKLLGLGRFKATKLDGLTLIDRASFEDYCASGTPWEPRG